MCGICGEWSPDGSTRETLARMSATIAHRGPDDRGEVVLGEVGLAMRRLSIVDLAGGHQPMRNEDGTAWIVANGEIYNHRELRRDLERRGHRFRTASDTEVILHLYEERGEHAVDDLRGMFAFALWDVRRRRLLLARDRFGQKPLFFAAQGRRFLFASEIKAILAALKEPPEPDLQALDEYLTLRFVPSPRTMFSGISKLPPAHVLLLDAADVAPPSTGAGAGDSGSAGSGSGVAGSAGSGSGAAGSAGSGSGVAGSAGSFIGVAPRLEMRRYWQLAYLPKRRAAERDLVEEVRAGLRDAVVSHLGADVPVGAFLSGGMDSSLVVALMAEALGDGVPTFAVGVEDAGFNELPYARLVASRWRTDHHEEMVAPDMARLLPRMVYHLDEPSDPIAACMYHSAALAARHVKVVLTGDGGDEVFAGYDRYFGFRWVRLYSALPAAVRRRLLGPALGALKDSASYKNRTQQARWVHELSFHEGGRRYAQATAFFRFGQEGKGGLYTPEMAARLAGLDPMESVVRGFEDAAAADDLDRMLHADSVTRLPEHSLMLTDRMTMAQGLEGRSPFLDHRLAELAATLPTSLKMKGRTLKHILRRAAAPYLPETILKRPKQGFMFPLGYWMKGPLLPVLRDLIEHGAVVERGIFSRPAIERLLADHLAARADHHVRLWLVLNVEIWYRLFILGQPLDDLQGMVADRLGSAA